MKGNYQPTDLVLDSVSSMIYLALNKQMIKSKHPTHVQSVSYEYVLEKNPDILFVVDRTKAIGGDDSKDDISTNELVAQTNAGKNQQIISLEPDVWYLSGGGLESMKLMIEDVNQAFK
jgi:iron complex transport system substrate-binding protein